MNQSTSLQKYLLGAACAGLLAGAWGIIEALLHGTAGTGLGSYVPWGLGVVLYLTFLGFSAAGLMLALVTTVFGRHEYEELAGLAAWTVVVTEACAGLAIATDLGHWERMYRFIVSPSFTSPMAWMFVFFTAMFIIYALKVLALLKGDSAGAHRLTIVSIPVAFLFYGTNGYIFGTLVHHPVWGGPVVPVLFVAAALMAGGALLCFLAWAFGHRAALVTGLGKAVLGMLVLFAVTEALLVLTGYQAGDADTVAALDAVLGGGSGVIFWVLHVGVGIIVPLVLLTRGNAASTAWGCLALVLAFGAARWSFVIAPQFIPPLHGLDQAFVHHRLALSYSPSLGEWLATLFVASLGLLGFVIGPRVVPGLFREGEDNA